MELSLAGLFYVLCAAAAAPILLSVLPRIRIPAVTLEVVAGVVIGPHVLGLVDSMDEVTTVLSLLGVAFLLFFAGLELDIGVLLHRRIVRLALAYVASLALAAGLGLALHALGIGADPKFLAVMLPATGLGVLLPIMKDQGLLETEYGQVVFGACAIAEIVPLVLIATAFPPMGAAVLDQLGRLAVLAVAAALIGLAALVANRDERVRRKLDRLADTSAQARVRLTLVALLGLAVLASAFGIEVIVGAFAAGIVIGADRERLAGLGDHLSKLQAIGFGLLIPVFFVTTGIRLDVVATGRDPRALGLVVLLMAAMLIVRGAPALAYRGLMAPRQRVAAGFFQATSLSFFIACAPLGIELGLVDERTATALVLAGLGSVLLYPLIAARVLGGHDDGCAIEVGDKLRAPAKAG